MVRPVVRSCKRRTELTDPRAVTTSPWRVRRQGDERRAPAGTPGPAARGAGLPRGARAARDLVEAAAEEAALVLGAGERERALVGRAGLGRAPEAAQDVGAGG